MNVFITGITGTLGTEVARIHAESGDRVFGCCQSESGAVEWRRRHEAERVFDRSAVLIDEVLSELGRGGVKIDRLYHLAALKHVDRAELAPLAATEQNILVTIAVAKACAARGIAMVFSDTDKSCVPTSVYGATKLVASRIVLSFGGSVVRLGNLIGSSGSVIRRWAELAATNSPIPVTDPEMTRLFIPVELAAICMMQATYCGVTVPNMGSVRIGDLASLFGAPQIIGPRPGERKHEWLIGPGEQAEIVNGRWAVGVGDCHPDGISSEHVSRWNLESLASVIWGTIGSFA